MIEAKIDELIKALTTNTEAVNRLAATASPSAPAAEAPAKPKAEKKEKAAAAETPKPEAAAGPTIDEIRQKAQEFVDGGGEPSVLRDIAVSYGHKKISEVAGTPNAQAAFDKLKKLVDGLAAS